MKRINTFMGKVQSL